MHKEGNLLYVGGYFYHPGLDSRSFMGAVNTTTGLASSWDPDISGPVFAMKLLGNEFYIAGGFALIQGQTANRLAPAEPANSSTR